MNKQILFLRLSYWIAAIADFAIAISALIPQRMGMDAIAYPMGLLSAIAFSWGILLLIADRKPVERRWILIPTIVVVLLLTIARLVFTLMGEIAFSATLLVFGVGLTILMVYSYRNANIPS